VEEFFVKGSYKARGNMIGETYRNEINTILDIMRTQEIPALFHGADWKESVEEFARNTGVYDNFKKHAGELFAEVEGMAEAANADIKELIIFNSLDEISSYSCQREITEKCTCIGIKRKSGHGVFVAQNLDLSAHLNKHQVILHTKYENSDLEQLIFTIPGLLGFTGVNNRSVAVVPNALTTLKYHTNGMPVTVIVRSILEKDTAVQAAGFVKKVTHGAAQNYTIGDRNGIFSLECSGDKKEQFEPNENEFFDYLVHTNHPLKNDLISVPGRVNMPVSSYESTIQRLDTADTCLRNADHAYDKKDLQAILTSHEHEPNCICRHGQGSNKGMTIGSVIYRLGGEIEMHFAKGPGCVNPYEKFVF
jgi:hypothetical protein